MASDKLFVFQFMRPVHSTINEELEKRGKKPKFRYYHVGDQEHVHKCKRTPTTQRVPILYRERIDYKKRYTKAT